VVEGLRELSRSWPKEVHRLNVNSNQQTPGKHFIPYLARVFTAFSFLLLITASASAQSRCRGADTDSDHFIRVINLMMGPNWTEYRTSFRLPLVTSAQVTLVSDSTVCARAGQAMDAHALTVDPAPRPRSTIPLFVFQIGTSYAVVNLLSPNETDADFIYFFGPSWNFTGTSFSQ
jgi:hypothetical protein